MYKTLALLNPRRRKTARRKTARKVARRKSPRRAVARRAASHPVRTMRRRRVARRKSAQVIKRRASAVVLSNPRRRRVGRRSVRRNPFGMSTKGILGQVTGIFSKENLAIAAGGVGSSVVIAQVTGRWGDKLPLYKKTDGTQNPAGIVLYNIAIPALAAIAVRKFAPNVAKGMLFGGLVMAAKDAIQLFAPTTYVSLYNPSADVSPAHMYLTPGGGDSARAALGLAAFAPGYQGSTAFARVRPTNGLAGPLDNSPAFARDPFGSRAGRN